LTTNARKGCDDTLPGRDQVWVGEKTACCLQWADAGLVLMWLATEQDPNRPRSSLRAGDDSGSDLSRAHHRGIEGPGAHQLTREGNTKGGGGGLDSTNQMMIAVVPYCYCPPCDDGSITTLLVARVHQSTLQGTWLCLFFIATCRAASRADGSMPTLSVMNE
jgi:hypothetical protein